jgi:hypothetical protein
MPRSTNLSVATMGIDIGKNSFHVVGLDQRGAIVVRQRWTRSQIGARLARPGTARSSARYPDKAIANCAFCLSKPLGSY